MQICAAIARAGEAFTLETCELDAPRANEVLIKVEVCWICHTDLSAKDHHYGTPMPAVLGHEGVGRVLALGEGVTHVAVGDRVVMSFGACGECPNCRAQMPAYCRRGGAFNVAGKRLDGSSPISLNGSAITGHFFGQSAFATHAIAAATNLVRLDEDLPPALMTALGCGVQTGMGAVVNVLQVGPDDAVAIFGCGTVGLAAVMAAAIAGCARIVAIDVREGRLELARELGATHTIDNSRSDVAALLKELALTCAFDNTGRPEVIETAFAALRPRGRLVLAGVSPPDSTIRFDPNRLMLSGRSVRGTAEGDADPRTFIPRMIGWYRAGRLPLGRLTTTYPFAQINQAVADMLAGRVIKPVLQMP